MDSKRFAGLLAIFAFLISTSSRAQESLVTYKSLTPEIALDLARAALADCRKRGYQAAVAVVDRFGVTQVMLRDRFADRLSIVRNSVTMRAKRADVEPCVHRREIQNVRPYRFGEGV